MFSFRIIKIVMLLNIKTAIEIEKDVKIIIMNLSRNGVSLSSVINLQTILRKETRQEIANTTNICAIRRNNLVDNERSEAKFLNNVIMAAVKKTLEMSRMLRCLFLPINFYYSKNFI